jgi:hypothetical protein
LNSGQLKYHIFIAASTFLCILNISITTCAHFKLQLCNDPMPVAAGNHCHHRHCLLHRFAAAAATMQHNAEAAQCTTCSGSTVQQWRLQQLSASAAAVAQRRRNFQHAAPSGRRGLLPVGHRWQVKKNWRGVYQQFSKGT